MSGTACGAVADALVKRGIRLLAGVSSFGMGGTNCHVLLASAPNSVGQRPALLSVDEDRLLDVEIRWLGHLLRNGALRQGNPR